MLYRDLKVIKKGSKIRNRQKDLELSDLKKRYDAIEHTVLTQSYEIRP